MEEGRVIKSFSAKEYERFEQLEAENERLREALEYIASCTSSWEEYIEQALARKG